MSRRHVIMFQAQFAPLVESGAKLQTIRPMRKRPIAVGDVLDLREWTGKPYRSKQRKLREVVCVGVESVEIDKFKGLIWLGAGNTSRLLRRAEAKRFARRDGFADQWEMTAWFQSMHGLPFKGTLITWRL